MWGTYFRLQLIPLNYVNYPNGTDQLFGGRGDHICRAHNKAHLVEFLASFSTG